MKSTTHFRHFCRPIIVVLVLTAISFGQVAPASISPENLAVLNQISANSLRGHLSFIASDMLEGRGTPSRGQDIAAEYIAAQFRRAGLEAVGDDGYFQTANWMQTVPNKAGFALTLRSTKGIVKVATQQISFAWDQPLNIARALVIKVDFKDTIALKKLTADQVKDKVIITEIPDFRREDRSKWGELFQVQNAFLSAVRSLNPMLILSIDRNITTGSGTGVSRLIDPERRLAANQQMPFLTIHDPVVVKLFDAMKPGISFVTMKMNLPAALEQPVKLRNVVGLLRGSDPILKDSYVLVTAHYDHIGMSPGAEGDKIFNGANDDGSGTVSVIELASALGKLETRPKRSIVFMTVFGEERGLLGSRYYGRHPIFPIEKTVANINLEQVGRTDELEAAQVNRASMTGFDFSDIGETFQKAGQLTGITVFKHPRNSDAFFGRSDNQALADQGVPAHTLCVAFQYPDYHGLGDHWEKVDYDNMARVNRMVALSLLMIADNPVAPKWNEANSKTSRYVEAWKKQHNK